LRIGLLKEGEMNDAGNNTPHGVSDQIERAKNELEEMIDLNPQVIMLLDRHGRILRTNRATLDFFGIPDFSQILHKELHTILDGSDPQVLTELLEQSDGYRSVEIQTRAPDGTDRSLKLSLVSSGKSRESSILIINDVSKENEKAVDLERQHKKEAVQALTGALMHNANQPLTVIMMRAQMVKLAIQQNRIDPAEVRRTLDDVMKLAMNVADILQSVDKPRDFVTEPYVDGIDILDLQRSANTDSPLDLTCSTMLNVLLTTLDTRISGTILHARRCGTLAHAIAEKAGLDARTCEVARQAGYVHDIGKLAIPDSITLKPAPLTEAEKDIMRTHAEVGYQIVRGLIFLEDEAEIVRTHHEYYDGKGYPRGLSGDNIPAAARVVACADAFEVMISGRPYRGATSVEQAVEEFAKYKGTQFDPVIANVLMENAEELSKLLLSIA
jgi:putative nucleotidyltransferase with HDIG domain